VNLGGGGRGRNTGRISITAPECRALEIVFLIYGAAFLLLGTAILVQPKRGSRFALSRTLWLLAAFALLHGINEWLDMLKLSREPNMALNAVGLVFLLTSFGFLYEFGRRIVVMSSPSTPRVLRFFLSWPFYVLLVTGLALTSFASNDPWQSLGLWGRYLLGFPGAVLTGFGLVFYYRFEILRLERLGVKPHFFVGGAAFIVFAGGRAAAGRVLA